MAHCRGPFNMEAGAAAPGMRDDGEGQIPTTVKSKLNSPWQEYRVDSLDEDNLSDGEDTGTLGAGAWHFGPHGVAEEDMMKYQPILKDMRGEEEMPFEPVEQPW